MRNFLVFIFSSIFISISFIHFGFQSNKQPNSLYVQFESQLDSLNLTIKKWRLKTNLSRQEHQLFYHSSRDLYKSIEHFIVFRYPELEKTLNGGPVPVIERDKLYINITKPSGFQVIEELLWLENSNIQVELHRNLTKMQSAIQKIQISLTTYPIQTWELFESVHMAMSRMMSLSISGYDSPVLIRTSKDCEIACQSIKNHLNLLPKRTQELVQFNQTIQILNQAIEYFKHHDFSTFNQFFLTKEILIPLQASIYDLHTASGYERYHEASQNPRSIGLGKHLYDSTYLNPYYSIRGNISNFSNEFIAFGKALFHDKGLSSNKSISCASCHIEETAFSDQLSKSKGNVPGIFTNRNSPTLINTAFQNAFFWDLRSGDINDQIFHVIHDKKEFNTTESAITKYVEKEYCEEIKKLNSDKKELSISDIKLAIEAYIRNLQKFDSKFFQNITSNKNNYTEQEINGFNIFMGKAACGTCHFPPHFGGNLPPHFRENEGEIIGVLDTANSNQLDSDLGLFEHYSNRSDEQLLSVKGMFKTSHLTAISQTAPYMHNGMYPTLKSVIDFYNHGGAAGKSIPLPQQTLASDSLNLNQEEISNLIAFLNTL